MRSVWVMLSRRWWFICHSFYVLYIGSLDHFFLGHRFAFRYTGHHLFFFSPRIKLWKVIWCSKNDSECKEWQFLWSSTSFLNGFYEKILILLLSVSQPGPFYPPCPKHLSMSRGNLIWLSQLGVATGTWWGEARNAAKHPITYRTAPHNQELSGPKCQL